MKTIYESYLELRNELNSLSSAFYGEKLKELIRQDLSGIDENNLKFSNMDNFLKSLKTELNKNENYIDKILYSYKDYLKKL